MVHQQRQHIVQILQLLDRSRWADIGTLCGLLGLDSLAALVVWQTNMCTAMRLGIANGGHIPTSRRQRRELQQLLKTGLGLFQSLLDNDLELPYRNRGIWPQIELSHRYMTSDPGSPLLANILAEATKEGFSYFSVAVGKNILLRSDDPHGITHTLATEAPPLGAQMEMLLRWAKEDGCQRSPHPPLADDPRSALQFGFYEYPELAFIPRYT